MLTNFFNAEALQREGENLWAATLAAGSPVVNRPDQAGVGQAESSSMEQSNVDLAAEFVKMINTSAPSRPTAIPSALTTTCWPI